jgi:hypothetical protein
MKVWRSAGSSASFRALLDRLLMKEAVGEPFMLQNLIVPVALVDPPTLSATVVPTVLGTPATAGELVAPVAGTRLADTGALAAGDWNVFFMLYAEVTDLGGFRLRRRNAADAADVWAQRIALDAFQSAAGSGLRIFQPLRVTLAINERLVIEIVPAGTAARTYQASIWTTGPF